MTTINFFVDGLVVFIGLAMLWLTIKSHTWLKKRKTDTIGRKIYRWLVIITSVMIIIWGFKPFITVFLLSALLVERLLVYKSCRRDSILSQFLTRINF